MEMDAVPADEPAVILLRSLRGLVVTGVQALLLPNVGGHGLYSRPQKTLMIALYSNRGKGLQCSVAMVLVAAFNANWIF